MCDEEAKEFEGVEILQACGLDQAHEHLVITLATPLERAVTEGDFAHDDIIAQATFGDIVVGTDIGEVQTRDKLVTFCRKLPNELVGTDMIEPDIQGPA